MQPPSSVSRMQGAISHTENLPEFLLDQAAAILAITATAPEAVSLVEVITTAVHIVMARTVLIPEAAAEVSVVVQAADHLLLVVIREVAAALPEEVVVLQVAVAINQSFFGTKSVI